MRSFYLENADAKQTANLVRALVKTRDIFVDEKLNLMVIRDTPRGGAHGREPDRRARPAPSPR